MSLFRRMLVDTIQSKTKAEATAKKIILRIAILPSIRRCCEKNELVKPKKPHPNAWKIVQGPCPRNSKFVLSATTPDIAIAHGAPKKIPTRMIVTVTGCTLGIGSSKILPAIQKVVMVARTVNGLDFSRALSPLKIAKISEDKITTLRNKSWIGVSAKL